MATNTDPNYCPHEALRRALRDRVTGSTLAAAQTGHLSPYDNIQRTPSQPNGGYATLGGSAVAPDWVKQASEAARDWDRTWAMHEAQRARTATAGTGDTYVVHSPAAGLSDAELELEMKRRGLGGFRPEPMPQAVQEALEEHPLHGAIRRQTRATREAFLKDR